MRYCRPLIAVLALHAGLLAWSAFQHSPTFDEVGHLPAGLSHWKFGRFELYRVNPPLVRYVAAAPLLFVPYECEWVSSVDRPVDRPEFPLGAHFIARNGDNAFRLFSLARSACISFSLLGAWTCWRWASELYGKAAGLVALLLWCFSPMVLGFGSLITPDVGAAAMAVAAFYTFWRWCHHPTWHRTYASGLMLGLASLVKFTLLVCYVLWPLLWLLFWASRRTEQGARSRRVLCGQLAVILLVGVFVVNVGYEFDGTFDRLGSRSFLSRRLCGSESGGDRVPGNRFRATLLGELPVPVPKEFLLGIDRQLYDFDGTKPSYLAGEWRDGGWYHYYVYALLVKGTLGAGIAVCFAVYVSFCRMPVRSRWWDELVLLFPVVTIFGAASLQTAFNHHLRYVLPVFPFVFIWASKIAQCFVRQHRVKGSACVAALVWSIGSSMWCFPHSLSYFNELVGGPRGGQYHLDNSNIDWGQDLLYLRCWLRQHSEAQLSGVVVYGAQLVDTSIIGVPSTCRLPPRSPQPGWYAISVSQIHERARRFRYFLRCEPKAMAGYSIQIYHITLEEANHVRRELGLPRLPGS